MIFHKSLIQSIVFVEEVFWRQVYWFLCGLCCDYSIWPHYLKHCWLYNPDCKIKVTFFFQHQRSHSDEGLNSIAPRWLRMSQSYLLTAPRLHDTTACSWAPANSCRLLPGGNELQAASHPDTFLLIWIERLDHRDELWSASAGDCMYVKEPDKQLTAVRYTFLADETTKIPQQNLGDY